MPATPVYQLPYPAAADPADVPVDMQELADQIEAKIVPGTVSGQLPTWDNAAKKWNPGPGLPGSPELGYSEITAAVVVSATSEPASNTIISLPAINFSAIPIELEFFSPEGNCAAVAGAILWVYLFDGPTSLGIIDTVRGNGTSAPLYARRRITPTAGSHTYLVKASITGGNGSVQAGPGTVGVRTPAFLRAAKVV